MIEKIGNSTLHLGDCIEVLKSLPDCSIDSIVTDPPYFLVGKDGGDGFMGKEWDGTKGLWKILWQTPEFVNIVGRVLKSLVVVQNMGEESIVPENVSTPQHANPTSENVLSANRNSEFTQVLKNASVRLVALTKRELSASLNESSPNLTSTLDELLSGVDESALFVIPILLPPSERKNTVVKNVTAALKAKECPEQEIIFTRTEAVKIKNVIEAMTGGSFAGRYTDGIIGLVDFVENIAKDEKFSVTISRPIMTEELTKNLTLLLYAFLVTRRLNKIPEDLIGNFFKITFLEALRVLKPGGHLLSFGGTRTYHRLACAIEDAGFEIRDTIAWAYGSGFPKSMDVSKAIDKAAGAEREVVGYKLDRPGYHLHGHDGGEAFGHGISSSTTETRLKAATITAPATEAAKQWQGWGTALKPALEPITVARKPLEGTVAENVLRHGTGGINVDGCRVGTDGGTTKANIRKGETNGERAGMSLGKNISFRCDIATLNAGRGPANLIHDGSDEVVGLFPTTTSGKAAKGGHKRSAENMAKGSEIYGGGKGIAGTSSTDDAGTLYGDSGSAARFFYCAKANKKERGVGNTHPTVKPIALMEYLVKLVTPPKGVVLDPFMGSGTTGLACLRGDWNFVGIERDPNYFEIAKNRIGSPNEPK